MKKLIVIILVILSVSVYSQKNGIGFRFGDPSGLTYKKYMGSHALEINIGRTYMFRHNYWYDNRFDYWYKKNHKYEDYRYNDVYSETFPLDLQIHYLFNKPIDPATSEVGTLDWYFGFGGQFRYQSYIYNYDYKQDGVWYYDNSERVSDINLGLDGVIGAEYKFAKAPFSVFLDFTLSMEVYNDPFYFYGQGGIGGRYNF